MQIIAKKGVKIYRDFYIDLDIKPAFYPKEIKLPLEYQNETVDIKKSIGDCVNKYEVVAVTGDDIPVYSPVKGIVIDIIEGPDFGVSAAKRYAVIKTVEDESPAYPLWDTKAEYTKKELLDIIRKAGIINESFSEYLIRKINPATKYKKLIIDCIDEQPYDLSKTSVLINYRNEVIGGAKILATAFGIPETEILLMNNFCTSDIFKKGIEGVKLVKTGGKYPIFPETVQYAHDHRGLLVGIQSCRALYRAAYYGEAQASSVVTVWGNSVDKPANIEVLTGTLVKELLNHCGAYGILERVVGGGIMKGYAASAEWPLQRYDGCLTVMPLKKHHKTVDCINCGRCASVCPMNLAPYFMVRKSSKYGENIAKQMCAGMCIYCGACAYICPARIPLNEYIKDYNISLAGGELDEKS